MKIFSKFVRAAIITLGMSARISGQSLRHEPAGYGQIDNTESTEFHVVLKDGEGVTRRLQKRIFDDKRRSDDALDVHGSVSVDISVALQLYVYRYIVYMLPQTTVQQSTFSSPPRWCSCHSVKGNGAEVGLRYGSLFRQLDKGILTTHFCLLGIVHRALANIIGRPCVFIQPYRYLTYTYGGHRIVHRVVLFVLVHGLDYGK